MSVAALALSEGLLMESTNLPEVPRAKGAEATFPGLASNDQPAVDTIAPFPAMRAGEPQVHTTKQRPMESGTCWKTCA